MRLCVMHGCIFCMNVCGWLCVNYVLMCFCVCMDMLSCFVDQCIFAFSICCSYGYCLFVYKYFTALLIHLWWGNMCVYDCVWLSMNVLRMDLFEWIGRKIKFTSTESITQNFKKCRISKYTDSFTDKEMINRC